jgi:hypothetical protein
VQSRKRHQIISIDRRRAILLLHPIAAFLRKAGLNRAESLECFTAAFARSLTAKSSRSIEEIGRTTGYADVVTFWSRNKEFLDQNGRPRALPLKGPNSFSRLVHVAARGLDPQMALGVLTDYGNVRKNRYGKYELIKPFFVVSSRTKMALEPASAFLTDASLTLSKILRRARDSRDPELFWRKVESTRISDADAEEFNAFASERSLLFLEELEDWLEAHGKSAPKRSGRSRRVGLGVFLIHSDPEKDR